MRFVIFAGGLLLAACTTVGPDYQAPQIDAPGQFAFQDVLALLNTGKTPAPVGTNWWEGFADQTLSQLVESAIEHNQQVAVALARTESARAGLALADAGDAAQIGAGTDVSIQNNTALGDGGADDSSRIGAGLGLALPLDIFGRYRRAVEAARAQLELRQSELRNTILQVSTEVAREYLQYRGNQRQLELLRESVTLQEKTLSIVRSRYQSGLSPELDLRRAETSVERLRADIPPLLESLSNSLNTLANIGGRFPGTLRLDLKNTSGIPDYNYAQATVIPVEVLRQRPDIRAAEANLKQAIAEIGIAEADFYPSFNLLGELSVSAGGIAGGSGIDLFTAAIGALVDQFVYDGGVRRARLEIARARARERLAEYRQALLDGALEIETTLVSLKSSLDRQAALDRAVQSSARSFEQADRLYQLGLSSFLDVVDAQRVLAAAEQQLAAERTRYATRIALLFRALGTDVAR